MTFSAAQFHLVLNHFPIVLIMTALPFLAWGALKGSSFARHTGLTLAIIAALLCIPTFLSGEPATWSGDGLSFSGTVGAVRRVGDRYEVIFVEPGEATVAGKTVRADRPQQLLVSPR